jgi:hypothetical protein
MLMMRDLIVTPSGRWLVRSVFVVASILFATVTLALILHAGPRPTWARIWCSPAWQNVERARVLKQLEHTAGKHIVIVRYDASHDFGPGEWVYNSADIDGSEIVWARDMGKQNAELLEYFRTRRVWLVEPDNRPVKLVPYVQ